MTMTEPRSPTEPVKFSTFAGVFAPSILTIIGVIIFMRAGFVIGQAGIIQALAILLIGKAITTLTTFSASAIATNTEVKGGGAYFLISRTLGPEFGGTIGLSLYLAQALSVPFYVLGFTEAVVRTLPVLQPYFSIITFTTLTLLFLVTLKGAGWAIKTQHVIMIVLGISIASFMTGAALRFDSAVFIANKGPFEQSRFSFWQLFAIYFPAVTGIMAGVNMSGDLKNPSKSIPVGTFAAIGVGLIVYAAQIFLCGGAIARETLIDKPYQSLMDLVPFRMGFLVTLGVFAATLSSAIGSFLGAPRILQSLGTDHLLRPADFFAKLSGDGEPRRALVLTAVISVAVLYFARNGSEGGALNMVASIVTMLFLWTYGITNLAAFVESFSRNPSFRPRFKLFHWSLALAGAIGSFAVSFLIDAPAALGAVLFVAALFMYVRKTVSVASFSDARRGFFYSRTRDNLLSLAQMPVHSKNWRPTIIVFSGNPNNRLTLVKYAEWLGCGRGITILAGILAGEFEQMLERRKEYHGTLSSFIDANRIQAFAEVLVAPDFELGMNQFLQVTSIGPIKPNLVLFGWPHDESRIGRLVRSLTTAKLLNMSSILLHDNGLPTIKAKKRRIDIWWRGMNNGSLMVILAYLLSMNRNWSGASIRILRVITKAEEHAATHGELQNLIDAARMNIRIKVIISTDPFVSIFQANSRDATAVFIGFAIPSMENSTAFHRFFTQLLSGMPTTLLVYSSGEADLTS